MMRDASLKINCLKITAVLLSIATAFTVRTGRSVAQDSRMQNSATTIKPTEKTVDEVFKNIKVLNGTPQSKLYPAMRFMAASLGFQCGSCHIIRNGMIDASLDDKPEKQTARQMIKMVIEINNTLFQGNPTVSCYTCHRGHRTPQGASALPLPTPAQRSATGAPAPGSTTRPNLPSANDVLNKFLTAIGGKTAAERITSVVVKGTTTTAIGQVVAYEAETVAPGKLHETFAIQNINGRCDGDSRCEYERVINAQLGWLKSGAGVQELAGEQLTDQKLSFPLFEILKLKDQYASFRISASDKIDDRDVYAVSAVRFDDRLERLYFDAESGLLRRRISYLRTLVGTIPQQTDFEDYREIDGLKLPFTTRMAFADPGSAPITRKFAEIKLNVPVEESKFARPQR
jgi:photosynthetic reaction center cytochrome c subunit